MASSHLRWSRRRRQEPPDPCQKEQRAAPPSNSSSAPPKPAPKAASIRRKEQRLALKADAPEHLTQLRAAKGKYLEGPCSLGRARRVSGRLSALRIRMTITYSPHPPLEVCLHQISRATNNYHKHHGVENDNANTGGTVERDGGRASRHCRAR